MKLLIILTAVSLLSGCYGMIDMANSANSAYYHDQNIRQQQYNAQYGTFRQEQAQRVRCYESNYGGYKTTNCY